MLAARANPHRRRLVFEPKLDGFRSDRGLEGVVAKRLRDPYRPRDRSWVKTKNRSTARFAEESSRAQRGVARSR
jgi:ATP-dependent DNA ligase